LFSDITTAHLELSKVFEMAAASINELLSDKLFQVIGSTPMSIAESLRKVDLKGKTKEGAMIFAIAIFAAAVNKATLETYIADSRFAEIRPIITASLSIQGKSNMTAMTLLGHCFLASGLANTVTFAQEFRKKMGQEHIWAGELNAGSLSDKQKSILLEKKRLTNREEATALGNGFLKWTGIDMSKMNEMESTLFGLPKTVDKKVSSAGSSMPVPPAVPTKGKTRTRRTSDDFEDSTTVFADDGTMHDIPTAEYDYRVQKLGQTDAEVSESFIRRGKDSFVAATRRLMNEDPEGKRVASASTTARS
jgi:hypothetical protein